LHALRCFKKARPAGCLAKPVILPKLAGLGKCDFLKRSKKSGFKRCGCWPSMALGVSRIQSQQHHAGTLVCQPSFTGSTHLPDLQAANACTAHPAR
jgi:hypothetical protein